jgi:hypothetical protein
MPCDRLLKNEGKLLPQELLYYQKYKRCTTKNDQNATSKPRFSAEKRHRVQVQILSWAVFKAIRNGSPFSFPIATTHDNTDSYYDAKYSHCENVGCAIGGETTGKISGKLLV